MILEEDNLKEHMDTEFGDIYVAIQIITRSYSAQVCNSVENNKCDIFIWGFQNGAEVNDSNLIHTENFNCSPLKENSTQLLRSLNFIDFIH